MPEKQPQFNTVAYEDSKFLFDPYIRKLSEEKKSLIELVVAYHYPDSQIRSIDSHYTAFIEIINIIENGYKEIQQKVIHNQNLTNEEKKNSLDEYKEAYSQIVKLENDKFITYCEDMKQSITNKQEVNN